MKNLREVLVDGKCIILENKKDFVEFCKLYNCFINQYSSSYVLKESIKDDVILCESIREVDVSLFLYPLYVKYFDKNHLVLTNFFQNSDKPITMYEYLVEIQKSIKYNIDCDNSNKKTLIFVKNISHIDFYDSLNSLTISMVNGKVFNIKFDDRKKYLNLSHDIQFSNTIEI